MSNINITHENVNVLELHSILAKTGKTYNINDNIGRIIYFKINYLLMHSKVQFVKLSVDVKHIYNGFYSEHFTIKLYGFIYMLKNEKQKCDIIFYDMGDNFHELTELLSNNDSVIDNVLISVIRENFDNTKTTYKRDLNDIFNNYSTINYIPDPCIYTTTNCTQNPYVYTSSNQSTAYSDYIFMKDSTFIKF